MIVDELLIVLNSIDRSSGEDDMENLYGELAEMPGDAACSAEFANGCILVGEEE